jgi:hypothetical protein
MLPKLKHSIEMMLVANISVDTFLDTYMVAKAFECMIIKQQLIKFGIENVKELRQRQIL